MKERGVGAWRWREGWMRHGKGAEGMCAYVQIYIRVDAEIRLPMVSVGRKGRGRSSGHDGLTGERKPQQHTKTRRSLVRLPFPLFASFTFLNIIHTPILSLLHKRSITHAIIVSCSPAVPAPAPAVAAVIAAPPPPSPRRPPTAPPFPPHPSKPTAPLTPLASVRCSPPPP